MTEVGLKLYDDGRYELIGPDGKTAFEGRVPEGVTHEEFIEAHQRALETMYGPTALLGRSRHEEE